MKEVYKILVFLLAVLLIHAPAFAQDSEEGIAVNTRISIGSKGKSTYRIKQKNYSLAIKMRGDIEINGAATEILSVSRGGYLEIDEKKRRDRWRLRVESGPNGEVAYYYRHNGRKVDTTELDEVWYREMLERLVMETGIGAESRTEYLLKERGVDGVLDVVERISSSSVKAKYMTYLFEKARFTTAQLIRSAGIAASISSSSDRSRFLKAAAPVFIENEDAIGDYMAAVSGIPSSGDKTRVLTHLLEEELIASAVAFEGALRVAKTIPSSGDKARFLKKAADIPHSPDANAAYLDVAATLPSSTDKSAVLLRFLEAGHLENLSDYTQALKVAQTISSSGDRARFLMVAGVIYQDSARDAYFTTVNSLPSSSDHAKVLVHLLEESRLDEASMMSLFQSASRISSSSDKARVLLKAANRVRGNEALVDAYLEAANTISSSSDHKRVLSALLN